MKTPEGTPKNTPENSKDTSNKGALIIRELKRNSGYTSGEELSRLIGISRSGVWKQIGTLRDSGYAVEARPRRGYRLAGPCPFNSAEVLSTLNTGFIGRELHFYPTLASTNLRAMELARDGAPEGTAVIADSQTQGKGRLGRSWHSPEGVNLHTSVILRPPLPPQRVQSLTLMAAVAVAETIAEAMAETKKAHPMEARPGARPTVKWPNDILILTARGPRKAAGILTELAADMDTVKHVVIGIGVNLNMDPGLAPPEVRGVSTSIAEITGRTIDRAAFARRLYSGLEKWYKGFVENGPKETLKRYRDFFVSVGKEVRVAAGGVGSGPGAGFVEGTCMGIDDDGALLVRTKNGSTERVVSGELSEAQ